MVWSSQVLTAATDTPTFLPYNVVTTSNIRWVSSASGTMTATDITDADHPTARLVDQHFHVDSRPNAAAVTTYLMMTADPTLVACNTIVIAGHNFGDVSGGVTLTLSTADSDNWLTNPQTITTLAISAGDNQRKCIAMATAYSGLTRLRLQCTATDGSTTFTPQICEFMYGPRIVLDNQPRQPWDSLHRRSDVVRFKSKSGTVKLYSRNNGQRIADFKYWASDTTELARFRSLFSGTNYGGKPFVYWDALSSSPHNAHWMVAEPEQDIPLINGPFLRETSLLMEEVAPFLVSEQ